MNFCPNCGAKLRPDAKFCGSCGKKIQRDDAEPADERDLPPQPQPTPQSTPQPQSQSTPTPQPQSTPTYRQDVTLQEKFLTTSGRLNRWRYFVRAVILLVPEILLYIVAVATTPPNSPPNYMAGVGLMLLLYGLIMLVPNVMLTIRRLHDLDLSGWFYLVFLIPFVNALFGFYALLAPGTRGPNRYGPDPLEVQGGW